MLEGSAALTHWAGEQRTDRSAQSHLLAPWQLRTLLGQVLLLEKNTHRQVRNLRVW